MIVLLIEFSNFKSKFCMKKYSEQVLIGFLFIFLLCQCNSGSNQKPKEIINEHDVSEAPMETITEDQNAVTSDLPSINIKADQLLKSPLKITVNSEGKWSGFEGELGTIELLDEHNNTLGQCILSTTENWMVNGPVNYNCDLIYNTDSSGKGTLVVKNNNPTGKVEHDKSFIIPVQYIKN